MGNLTIKLDPWATRSERIDHEAAQRYAAASLEMDPNGAIDALDLAQEQADDLLLLTRDLLEETAHPIYRELEDAGFDARAKFDEYRRENMWAGEEKALERFYAIRADAQRTAQAAHIAAYNGER